MLAKREYEAKRVRSFILSQKTTFSWVDFDPSVPEIFCQVNRENPNKADKSGSFVGITTFRKQLLKCRNKSLGHIVCVEVKKWNRPTHMK